MKAGSPPAGTSGDGLQLHTLSPPLTAATDVPGFFGQRKFYKVFPPFQGGMSKQPRNGKYITLFTFQTKREILQLDCLKAYTGPNSAAGKEEW